MGSMLFTIMAALAQMEHDIKRERVTDSIIKRREAGKNLGGRPHRVTASQIRSAVRLVKGGAPAAQVARDLGMSRATFYRRSRAQAEYCGVRRQKRACFGWIARGNWLRFRVTRWLRIPEI